MKRTESIFGALFLALVAAAIPQWRPGVAKEPKQPDLLKSLSLVPPDAVGFAHFALADLWAEDDVKRLLARSGKDVLAAANKEFEKQSGFRIEEISDLTGILMPPTATDRLIPILGVFALSRPCPRDKLVRAFFDEPQELGYRGKWYYASPTPRFQFVMHFADDRTLVVAERDVFHRWVDSILNASPHKLASALKKARENHHVLAGLRMPEDIVTALRREEFGLELLQLLNAKRGILTANLSLKPSVAIDVTFGDEEDAEKARLFADHILANHKSLIEQFAGDDTTTAARILRDVEAGLEGTRIFTDRNTVKVRYECSLSIDDFNALAKEYTGIMEEIPLRGKSAEKMLEIVRLFHYYSNDYRVFPPPATVRKGKPLLSWRVHLLPYLGEEARKLHEEFHLDEPWDSEHNKKLLARMPDVYAPIIPAKEPHTTYYQLFTGPQTLFDEDQPSYDFLKLTNQDGTSATILIIEAGEAVPWTKPADLDYTPEEPLPKLGGMFKSGFNVAFCDGSVRFIKYDDTKEKALRAAIHPNDRQPIRLE